MSQTKTPMPQSIRDMANAQAAASQINTLPRTERKPTHESDDRDIVHKETMLNGGVIDAVVNEIDIEKVMDPSALAFERFMADVLTIHCHDAGGPEDPMFAEITVNGNYKLVVRGETADLPRSHVEVLARAKHIRVIQKKTVDKDGGMGYEEKAVLKHTYPFSVLHDPAGSRGAAWVRQLFQNPG